MQPVATDGLSVINVSANRDAGCGVYSGGPKELCTRLGPHPRQAGAFLRENDVRIFPPNTIPSGPDVRISLHAVDQHLDWLAADAVRRHINFLVHGQVTIIFVVSVCLSVCLCIVFLSRL